MGTMLRSASALICLALSFLLTLTVDIECISAQVKLENLYPFNLEMAQQSDLSDNNFWLLAPGDHELSSLFGIRTLYSDEDEEGFFILDKPEGIYLALRPLDENEYDLMRFHISNESGRAIDEIQVSIDVAFLVQGFRQSEIILTYQTSSGARTKTLLRSDQFEKNPELWRTTSLNSLVDNLLLENGESIELTLSFRSEGEGLPDAVGLNRLNLDPKEFMNSSRLSAGDIIITEILAGAELEGERFDYIEFYNPTFRTIDLRGMTIKTGNGDFRIREPLSIKPYQLAVVANRSAEGIHTDQILNNLAVPSHGGMIELLQNEERIGRAAYDEQKGNRSWELENSLHMMDGYASMNNYQVSEEYLKTDLYGSPGKPGSTVRVFSLAPDPTATWSTVSVPGRISGNIDRRTSYWTDGEDAMAENNQIQRGAAILKKQSSSDFGHSKWIVEELDAPHMIEMKLPDHKNSWILIGNPFVHPIPLYQIEAVNGEFFSETAQIWNARDETFELLKPDSQLDPWQAIVMKNRDAESVRFHRERERRMDSEGRERMIRFNLKSADQTDNAAVLYFHEEGTHGADKFDAGKLWPVFDNNDQTQRSLLYFIGQRENERVLLAQDSRPVEPENPFEVTLGHTAYNISGEHTLSWDEFINIPDEWELTLKDRQTGLEVNMKEENQITFNARPNLQETVQFSELPRIHPLKLTEPNERFLLSVNPDPHLTESMRAENGSGPDKIELYQNYPNPFSSVTNINFFLPEQNNVILSVYNIVGQRVAQLLNGDSIEGESPDDLVWDASEMPSGLYILRLEAGNNVLTRKMTLIK